MIPQDQLELITGAVDEELSASDARAFRALLAESSEARAVYAKLKADSDRVRELPQVAPPPDLLAKILGRLAVAPSVQPPLATPAPDPVRAPGRQRTWLPAAVAASVLLCITAGSFAFFASQSSPRGETADRTWSDVLPAQHDTASALPSPTAGDTQASGKSGAGVRVDVTPVPPLPMPRSVEVAVAPEPRPVQHDLIASPVWPKLPPFAFVQVRVPFLRTVAELDGEDVRQELADELGRDPAFRFDLFVRDTARGVEVFQNAAKAAGLTVFADAATLDKLKKRHAHAVVVYTECLTPAELTALFAQVAEVDKKFTPRVCDLLHATPVVRADENDLKHLLGIDAGLFKRSRAEEPGTKGKRSKLLVDKDGNPKSVSAGTIDSVTKALTTPPSKSGEKPAVLLTWQTTHPAIGRTNPAASSELKQFLATRGDRKPNAVPAIIVIRPAG